MAGDWIKWGKGFLKKPEIVGVANALDIPREKVACSYMLVAEWLDSEGQPDDPEDLDSDITIEILSRNARDNRHALLSHIDGIADVSGFAEALEEKDWIALTETAVVFRRAARHNTETAKRRALATKRQARKRARDAAKTSRIERDNCHANGATRVEESREEVKEPPIVPQGTTHEDDTKPRRRRRKKPGVEEYSDRFEEFWAAYPPLRKQGKRAAWQAWRKAITRAMPAIILAAAKEFAVSPKGRGGNCPGPSPWLNQSRWEDDRAAWQHSDDQPTGPHDPVDEPMKEY